MVITWPSVPVWITTLVILALWWGFGAIGIVAADRLPPPLVVLDAAIDLWRRDILQGDILASLGRLILGFIIGSAVAVALGTLTGLSRRADKALEPTFAVLRAVPAVAWAPLLVLWFGADDPPKVVLVAIGAFVPTYVDLVAGIKGVDRKLVEVARAYGLGDVQIARRVVLPAIGPSLFTGLRLGATQAWLFLVVAELLGSWAGLGFRLAEGLRSARVDVIFVAIVTLAILVTLTDALLRWVGRRVLGWQIRSVG